MRIVVAFLCLACAAPQRKPVEVRVSDGPEGLGAIVGVAELGESLVVLSDAGVTVLHAGVAVARDAQARAWAGAPVIITAPDGTGRWVVAVSADGKVERVNLSSEVRDVSATWQISGAKGVADLGATGVAVAAEDGLTAGAARYPGVKLAALAGARGRLAGIAGKDDVEIWDLAHEQRRTYGVPGVTGLAFDAAGRCLIAAGNRVYLEGAGGHLELRATLPAPVGAMVVSGDVVWLAAGNTLYLLRAGAEPVPVSVAAAGPGLRLAASAEGAVWLIAGDRLRRVTLGGDTAWETDVQPVYQRICSRCHRPGGAADVDLSTASAWLAHKDLIRKRVVVDRDMPPAGTAMSDMERAAVERWVGR